MLSKKIDQTVRFLHETLCNGRLTDGLADAELTNANHAPINV